MGEGLSLPMPAGSLSSLPFKGQAGWASADRLLSNTASKAGAGRVGTCAHLDLAMPCSSVPSPLHFPESPQYLG